MCSCITLTSRAGSWQRRGASAASHNVIINAHNHAADAAVDAAAAADAVAADVADAHAADADTVDAVLDAEVCAVFVVPPPT